MIQAQKTGLDEHSFGRKHPACIILGTFKDSTIAFTGAGRMPVPPPVGSWREERTDPPKADPGIS